MKYEKAMSEVVRFDGIEIFMALSGDDLAALKQAIANKVGQIYGATLTGISEDGSEFGCSNFMAPIGGEAVYVTLSDGRTVSFTYYGSGNYGSSTWTCGSY